MHSILFKIGSISVYSYGFMIALGFLFALLLGTRRAPHKGLSQDAVYSIAIAAIVGGMLGAKLLYYMTDIKNILANPRLLLDIRNGFVVYGGIIGGVLLAWLYCRKKRISFIKYFDLLVPSLALAQGIGRIGCHLAGCCYGLPTSSWCGVVFPEGSLAPAGISLLPAQLFSAGGDFLLCALLLLVARKQKFDGQIASFYMLLYGVGRFLLEYLRNDPRGAVGGLSTSQFISILIVLFGLGFYGYWCKKHRDTVGAPPQTPPKAEDESGY